MSASWVIVGKVPPPIGGVTVFIERFRDRLDKRGSKVTVLDPRRLVDFPALFRSVLSRPDFVMLNSIVLLNIFGFRLLFPCSKLVLVDHNHSRKIIKYSSRSGVFSFFAHTLYRFGMSLLDRVWVVSPHLRPNHEVISHGTRVGTISPYIRPDERRYNDVLNTYSSELRSLLNEDFGEEILFVTSAYKLMLEGGRDLYGFDLALEALSDLIVSGRSARLIAFIADDSNAERFAELQEKVRRLQLEEVVIWEIGQKVLWPVFMHADCYLRLTSTDGSSVSVKESLDLGCPVIASDVTPRDPRCILFPYPNVADLVERMKAVPARASSRVSTLSDLSN